MFAKNSSTSRAKRQDEAALAEAAPAKNGVGTSVRGPIESAKEIYVLASIRAYEDFFFFTVRFLAAFFLAGFFLADFFLNFFLPPPLALRTASNSTA